MPYVLQHNTSRQIYACLLRNGYDLIYYGVKVWEDEDAAVQQLPEFLASQPSLDQDAWTLLDLDEHLLKLCNVKLKNDPRYRCYLGEDGRPYTELLPPSDTP